MRVLGIDEAGRGCVLGPLVVAAYVVDGVPDDVLRRAGANDSKLLTAKKRLEAREKLTPLGKADVRTIECDAIDGGNLNHLEEALIVELVAAWDPDVVLIDALGHPKTLPAVVERLRGRLPPTMARQAWTMEPEADRKHAVVGAASIFAKTTRDARLDGLKQQWGELGSGYPHDEVTRSWLTTWAKTGQPWPGFVRTRWETISNISQGALFPPAPAPAPGPAPARAPRAKAKPRKA